MILSAKAKENLLILLDSLKIEKPQKENLRFPTGQAKTKIMAEIIKNLRTKIPAPEPSVRYGAGENFKKGSILIIAPKKDELIYRAGRNIPDVGIVEARNLNVLDLLSFKYLLVPKETIKVIKEIFLKS